MNGIRARLSAPAIQLRRDVFRYMSGGLGATVADFSVYLGLVRLFDVPPPLAQAASRAAGGLVSFLAHRFWTFRYRTDASMVRPFVRFWIVWGAMYVLAIAAIALTARWFPRGPVRAKLLADAAVAAITFVLQRHWTFQSPPPAAPDLNA